MKWIQESSCGIWISKSSADEGLSRYGVKSKDFKRRYVYGLRIEPFSHKTMN
jgi:hypothetical protein